MPYIGIWVGSTSWVTRMRLPGVTLCLTAVTCIRGDEILVCQIKHELDIEYVKLNMNWICQIEHELDVSG